MMRLRSQVSAAWDGSRLQALTLQKASSPSLCGISGLTSPVEIIVLSMLLLLLLLIASLASSVSIPIKNPTRARTPDSGLFSDNEECTNLNTWGPDQYMLNDCYKAVRLLNTREVYKYGMQEWEFLAPGSRPMYKPLSLTMQTPRRYTHRRSSLSSVPRTAYARGRIQARRMLNSLCRKLYRRGRDAVFLQVGRTAGRRSSTSASGSHPGY